jgi:mannose-6-phosphate isomerase-like protein (cupin superfamily)
MTGTPIDLFASFINLGRDGRAQAGPRLFDPDLADWQVKTFHVETDADVHADHWEIHTDADEIVSCLAGGIRLHFRRRQPGGPGEIRLTAGTAAIVPRGQWHRIELDAPSDIMSVTVPRGSRLADRTEA